MLDQAHGGAIESIVKQPGFYTVNIPLQGEPKTVWVNEAGTALEGPINTATQASPAKSGTVVE